MLGVLSDLDPPELARLVRTLEEVDRTRCVEGLAEIARESCPYLLLVVATSSVDPVRARLLWSVRHSGPEPVPLFWMTDFSPGNLVRLAKYPPTRIFPIDVPREQLSRAVLDQVGGGCPRDVALAAVRRLDDVPELVRRSLSLAVLRHPPFRTVASLAAAVGRGSSALNKAWRDAGFDEVRLKDLLNLIQLATVEQQLRTGASIDAAIRRSGLPRRTAERICRRVGRTTLSDLRTSEHDSWARVSGLVGERRRIAG